jgi:hypothetical protein
MSSNKTVKPTAFNHIITDEERKQRQEELEGKPMLIQMKDTMKLINHTIKNMGTKDVCFCVIHDIMAMSVFNNEEMKRGLGLWKDLAKKNKLTVLECNNQTREINGKNYYLMTITPRPNNANYDPIGMALGFMVSGYIYVFRQEKNRDAVFGYIKKFCKEE